MAPFAGFVKNGVNTFLGIPYAAPPVGALRWMPPAPAEHHALLDATEFANTCPQVTELGAFAGPTSVTEDCLYLNVFTTGRQRQNRSWSGFTAAEILTVKPTTTTRASSPPVAQTARPTVVVTINYRLGLFGFLSESHLNAEGHPWGNYGILDNQAALRWVQANIAAFGGNPNNVTLGGQSAGSVDTAANLISPLAAGLFHRAINQSPPIANFLRAQRWLRRYALQRGNNFAAAANCSSSACLRGLSAERILQLQGTPNANGPYVTGIFVDGTIIPIQPEMAWTTGQYNKMPIMGGATKDESTFGESIREYFSGPPQAPLTAQQYTDLVNATYVPPLYVPGAAAQVLAQYPAGPNPQAT